MKIKYLLIVLYIAFFNFSCKKEVEDQTGPDHNMVVLAKGSSCGDSYVVRFDRDIPNLPNNFQDFTYNEINLPEDYKVAGKELQVTFRAPTSGELIDCEDALIVYPQIYILSAHE
jgi:hypothetical protein